MRGSGFGGVGEGVGGVPLMFLFLSTLYIALDTCTVIPYRVGHINISTLRVRGISIPHVHRLMCVCLCVCVCYAVYI